MRKQPARVWGRLMTRRPIVNRPRRAPARGSGIAKACSRLRHICRPLSAALLLFLCASIRAQTGATAEPAGGNGPPVVSPAMVDAVVTGDKGEPIHGLTAADFHLFEDGKEQAITGFQTHTGPAVPGMSRQQLFALLIGPQSADDQKWIQQAAAKFIADNAGPDRRISIIYTDACYGTISSPFMSEASKLQQALNQWPDLLHCEHPAEPDVNLRTLYYAELAKGLAQVPGHKVVVLFPSHAGPSAEADKKAEAASPTRHAKARGEAKPEAHEDPFDMELEFRKANASVYPVRAQAGGTTPSWALYLAESTGGRELLRGNETGGVFEQLTREQDDSYTLVYQPGLSAEGSCHPLKITVNRPGAAARGRNLYCNVPQVAVAAVKPRENDLDSLAASPDAGNVAGSISVPFFYQANGVARVYLALEIPSPGLDASELNGGVHAEMNVLGLAYIPGGDVVARFTRKAKFDFDTRAQFDDFLRHPLHYECQFEVPPGNYQFKLVFRTAKDHFGVVETPLEIDPFNAAQLSVSAIALSRDVRPISQEDIEDATDQGKNLLLFRGNRIAVSGSDVLPKTGAPEAYFEIYQPLSSAAGPVQLAMHLRVLDEKTGSPTWDSGDVALSGLAQPVSRVIPVALKLPVASLPRGTYRAELTVKNSAGAQAARSVPFRVE